MSDTRIVDIEDEDGKALAALLNKYGEVMIFSMLAKLCFDRAHAFDHGNPFDENPERIADIKKLGEKLAVLLKELWGLEISFVPFMGGEN